MTGLIRTHSIEQQGCVFAAAVPKNNVLEYSSNLKMYTALNIDFIGKYAFCLEKCLLLQLMLTGYAN